jgi:aldehyde dehydrogenase
MLVNKKKVSKAAFTGSTPTGRLVMQYATENIIL